MPFSMAPVWVMMLKEPPTTKMKTMMSATSTIPLGMALRKPKKLTGVGSTYWKELGSTTVRSAVSL